MQTTGRLRRRSHNTLVTHASPKSQTVSQTQWAIRFAHLRVGKLSGTFIVTES